jgi:hypothetical protein
MPLISNIPVLLFPPVARRIAPRSLAKRRRPAKRIAPRVSPAAEALAGGGPCRWRSQVWPEFLHSSSPYILCLFFSLYPIWPRPCPGLSAPVQDRRRLLWAAAPLTGDAPCRLCPWTSASGSHSTSLGLPPLWRSVSDQIEIESSLHLLVTKIGWIWVVVCQFV